MAPLSAAAERRNLGYRIASGAVLAPLILLCAFLPYPLFDIVIAIGSAIGLTEWLRMVTGRRHIWAGAAPLLCLGVYWYFGPAAGCAALVGLTAILGIALGGGLSGRLRVAFGLPYVGLTLLSLSWLHDSFDAGWPFVFFVFFIVWATDIGAFIVGRSLGGPRLAPRISPNKTWSGFIGGLGFAAAVAACLSVAANASKPWQVVEIAIGLSLLGQGGDLFESAVKRKFGVKDSGDLIPGHGGMLDRIDALLWAAPSFALLHLFGLTAGLSP
jgi:phosphatidate cytidylyltransferase